MHIIAYSETLQGKSERRGSSCRSRNLRTEGRSIILVSIQILVHQQGAKGEALAVIRPWYSQLQPCSLTAPPIIRCAIDKGPFDFLCSRMRLELVPDSISFVPE